MSPVIPASSHLDASIDYGAAGWYPDQAGYAAWSFDPMYSNASDPPSAGVQYAHRCALQRTTAFTNVYCVVDVAGSGVQLPVNCFIGLYDSTGQRRGVTAALDTPFQSLGLKTAALVVDGGQSLTVAGGVGAFIWLAVLIGTQATTAVQLAHAPAQHLAGTASITLGLTNATKRNGHFGTGASALAASFNPLTLTNVSSGPFWLAAS